MAERPPKLEVVDESHEEAFRSERAEKVRVVGELESASITLIFDLLTQNGITEEASGRLTALIYRWRDALVEEMGIPATESVTPEPDEP